MIKYYSCEKLEKTGLVKTAYTLKFGGHWRIYSLNPDGEDLKYYEELAKAFEKKPSDMVRIPQKHTDNIRIVTKEIAGEGVVKKETDEYYDALVTNEKGIMLCTVEADCTPVYILDTKNKAIAMIHSGWRGTIKNISIKVIEKMQELYGTEKENVLISFGPSICGDCYEIREDVYNEFEKNYKKEEMQKIIKPHKKDKEKFLLDVTKAIKISLERFGIKSENIEENKYCTYHDDIFDSWRRDGEKRGHILSTIMLL